MKATGNITGHQNFVKTLNSWLKAFLSSGRMVEALLESPNDAIIT